MHFHTIVLAFACFCLLGHAIARQSVELISNLISSFLLLVLAFACFGLLWLLWQLALSVPLLLRFLVIEGGSFYQFQLGGSLAS